jgi:hypothetical protein
MQSFNRQRAAYPKAREASNHARNSPLADEEILPGDHHGGLVWAFLRDTHLLASVSVEL